MRPVAPVSVQAAGLVTAEEEAMTLGRRCVASGAALLVAFNIDVVYVRLPLVKFFLNS